MLDGQLVSVSRFGGRLLDAASSNVVRTIPISAPEAQVLTVATVDGRPVSATGMADGTLLLHDLATGQQLGPPLTGHQAAVTCLGATELEGRPILFSASRDNSIRVWDIAVHVYST